MEERGGFRAGLTIACALAVLALLAPVVAQAGGASKDPALVPPKDGMVVDVAHLDNLENNHFDNAIGMDGQSVGQSWVPQGESLTAIRVRLKWRQQVELVMTLFEGEGWAGTPLGSVRVRPSAEPAAEAEPRWVDFVLDEPIKLVAGQPCSFRISVARQTGEKVCACDIGMAAPGRSTYESGDSLQGYYTSASKGAKGRDLIFVTFRPAK